MGCFGHKGVFCGERDVGGEQVCLGVKRGVGDIMG